MDKKQSRPGGFPEHVCGNDGELKAPAPKAKDKPEPKKATEDEKPKDGK